MDKAALVALFTVRLRRPRRIAPDRYRLKPGSQGAAPQATAEWQPAPEPQLLEDGAPKQVLKVASGSVTPISVPATLAV